jgi:hypothetical protein
MGKKKRKLRKWNLRVEKKTLINLRKYGFLKKHLQKLRKYDKRIIRNG